MTCNFPDCINGFLISKEPVKTPCPQCSATPVPAIPVPPAEPPAETVTVTTAPLTPAVTAAPKSFVVDLGETVVVGEKVR